MFRILPVLLKAEQISKLKELFGWRFKHLFCFERHITTKQGITLYICMRRVR